MVGEFIKEEYGDEEEEKEEEVCVCFFVHHG